MTVTKEKNDDTLTVTIEGSVDSETAPVLSEELEDETEGIKTMYFDLKDMNYISSAGLRVFLGLYKGMIKKGGEIILKNATDDVKEVFEMTGFSAFVTIED